MLIAHLSDPHLGAGPMAAAPSAALEAALAGLAALPRRPDCVVLTGDLTNHGHPDEYAALRAVIDDCDLPVHLVTGNHDEPEALAAAFAGTRYLAGGAATRYVVEYPQATLVVADSWVPGTPAGRLGAGQLDWIDDSLAARPDVPAFVCLHHPPLPLGMPFLDGVGLADGAALAEVVGRHPNVARVLAGHVHRAVTVPFAGTLLTAAPSVLQTVELRMHDATPPDPVAEPTGYLLHLGTVAGFVTHLVAVDRPR